MLPLRDAFVTLFFVTVGVLINPRNLLSSAQFLLAILLLVIVGKFIVWTAVVKLFRYPLRTAILVGVGLTQIGEFSFILVQVARSNGWLARHAMRQRWPRHCSRFWRTPHWFGPLRRHCRKFLPVYH
jgi:CPA2 family monovalent cation:H+ antiporter-2